MDKGIVVENLNILNYNNPNGEDFHVLFKHDIVKEVLKNQVTKNYGVFYYFLSDIHFDTLRFLRYTETKIYKA